jgi:hypothetical protein
MSVACSYLALCQVKVEQLRRRSGRSIPVSILNYSVSANYLPVRGKGVWVWVFAAQTSWLSLRLLNGR